ncbi:MAG: translation initiation factor IF-6 [archaeon]
MATIMMGINNNPNIGLYAFVTNKFALVGREARTSIVKEMERILEVPVHRIAIAGTSLIGVFLSGNEKKLLVPSITFERELKELDRLKIKYEVFQTDLTCLGNNILMNKNGALVNPDFSDEEVKKLKSILKIPVEKFGIAKTETPGACAVINGDKALIHRDTSSIETKKIEKVLKVQTMPGTVNMGVPQIKSGVLCNNKGLIIGELCGPAEIMNTEEALGFIEG